jgi:hypothetical protein
MYSLRTVGSQNVNGGPVLRKLKHPPPDPNGLADPLFLFEYNKAQRSQWLREQLDLSHLDQALRNQIYALVIKYWSVFDERGVFILVRNYECVIDTGNAAPIAVKKIYYGPTEIPIMRRAILALQKVGHIQQIHDGQSVFKAIFAPKPHQEHVRHINNYVWRFCVNYAPLNLVTRIIPYPIPRCNSAVFVEFGHGRWLWLFDAPSGYHQLAVKLKSQEKLAFQGPNAIKWTYTVMPFGPTNSPTTFINFIDDGNNQWKLLASLRRIVIGNKRNTRITSEVESKVILMGHPISCCHALVVRSFFIHCKMIISP